MGQPGWHNKRRKTIPSDEGDGRKPGVGFKWGKRSLYGTHPVRPLWRTSTPPAEGIFKFEPSNWPMRVVEFYCGIGGFAAAAPGAEIVAAFDQSPLALQVYRQNYPLTRALQCNLENITAATIRACRADLWWLSPPCQPYTLRGKQKDLDDPRALSFSHLIGLLPELRPDYLGLENVIGFRHSHARELLLQQLSRCDYRFQERLLCPTEIGIPSRRPRYYLVASQPHHWTQPLNNADSTAALAPPDHLCKHGHCDPSTGKPR